MAGAESDITNRIMMALSPAGVRCWKNVRGLFLTLDGNRKTMAGLAAAGSSDLIGLTKIKITAADVGREIGVFTAVEVKTATGKPSAEQLQFIKFIQDNGGFAGIARSPEDALKIVHNMR